MSDDPRCGLRCARVTKGGICDRCARLTAEDLAAMDGLYADVRDKLLEAQASTMGDRVSGTRERPLGFSVDALSLIGPINNPGLPMLAELRDQTGPPPMLDTLSGWARVVHEDLNSTAELHMTVESLSGFLLINHDWSRKQEWAEEYAFDIRGCAHEARRLAGLYDAPVDVKHGVPCRNRDCKSLGLFIAQGSDRVECPVCPQRMTFTEYEDWVKWNAAAVKEKGKTA